MPIKPSTSELRKIKQLFEKFPDEVAAALLDCVFWPHTVKTEATYHRFDDDSRTGSITVSFSRDTDAWIEIMSQYDPEEAIFSHRFRVQLLGGGQSPRVRNALLMLAIAIKLDNDQLPQLR